MEATLQTTKNNINTIATSDEEDTSALA